MHNIRNKRNQDHPRRVELTDGSDAKDLAKVEASPIKHFLCWFQTISANLDTEAQKRESSALQKATSSVLTNEWYDEGILSVVKVALIQSDTRRVKYSARRGKLASLIEVEIEAPPETLLEGDNID